MTEAPGEPLYPELKHDLQQEADRQLRRRVTILAVGLLVFQGLSTLSVILASLTNGQWRERQVTWGLILAASGVAFLAALTWHLRRREWPRRILLRFTFMLVFVMALMELVDFNVRREAGQWILSHEVDAQGLFSSFLLPHLLACLLVPMTAREASMPAVPLMGFYALSVVLTTAGRPGLMALHLLIAPGLVAPGIVVSFIRTRRFLRNFRLKWTSRRYDSLRQELMQSRQIHESLFPEPISEGPVRFCFAYEPAQLIGGDFVYLHRRDGDITAVVIDVNGHGIAAALTVNRIHGELDRIFADEPDIEPDRLLRRVNHYFALTLARHAIYATGLCIRLSLDGHCLYANAGHPPVLHVTHEGQVEPLEPTGLMLGVLGDEEYPIQLQRLQLKGDERLIACTDGAPEAKDPKGHMFGFDRVRRGVERLALEHLRHPLREGDWPGAMEAEVRHFRNGPPHDDTLFVELRHEPPLVEAAGDGQA